jgi:hypothetical protein
VNAVLANGRWVAAWSRLRCDTAQSCDV